MKDLVLLGSLIDVCDIHASRLSTAVEHIHHLLPVQVPMIDQLSDEELSFMDMIIYRFAKLQDVIGAKVFPLTLSLLQEDDGEFSYLDRLNKLEKLGVLPSARQWVAMRNLRNHLTHEYPDHPELMAANFNKAVAASQELLVYWKVLRAKVGEIAKRAVV